MTALLEPVLIAGIQPGGQLTITTEVENWPGDTEVQGPDLMVRMEAHAKAMGCEIIGDIINKAMGKALRTAALSYVKYALQPYGALLTLAQTAGKKSQQAMLKPIPFEVNDLGYQRNADRQQVNGQIQYQENRPGDLFRRWELSASPRINWNFDGDRLDAETSREVFGRTGRVVRLDQPEAGVQRRILGERRGRARQCRQENQ